MFPIGNNRINETYTAAPASAGSVATEAQTKTDQLKGNISPLSSETVSVDSHQFSELSVLPQSAQKTSNVAHPVLTPPHSNGQMQPRNGDVVFTPRIATLSQLDSSGVETDKQACDARSGQIWECTNRTPGPGGGHLYTFKLKAEYDDVTYSNTGDTSATTAKLKQIFPAIESTGAQMKSTIPSKYYSPRPRENEKSIAVNQSLLKLGYSIEVQDDGVFVTMPDKQELESGWEELRKENPNLPPFKVCSSDGIASDLAFVKNYMDHDVVLSTGEEFMHDQSAHIIPALRFIISTQGEKSNYSTERGRFKSLFSSSYNIIDKVKGEMAKEPNRLGLTGEARTALNDQIKQAEVILGSAVDISTGFENVEELKAFAKEGEIGMYRQIADDPRWIDYYQTKRDISGLDAQSVVALWENLNDVAERLDFLSAA